MIERTALITASDKTAIPELATALYAAGYNLVSLGGTAGLLDKHGLPVTMTETFLGTAADIPERITADRARRDIAAGYLAQCLSLEFEQLREYGLPRIDAAYINLMPPTLNQGTGYRGVKKDKSGSLMIDAAIEGGRIILVEPDQIPGFIGTLQSGSGQEMTSDYRAKLGVTAGHYLERYDARARNLGAAAIAVPDFQI